MISNLNHIECITLFAEDLSLTTEFYEKIFSAKTVYQDENCKVFKLDNLMINVLKISESPELITPAKVAELNSGSRLMFTIKVDDVNSVCNSLKENNVKLLNGPIDRPWGRRTATFSDPSGNVWEVAQEI